MALYAISDLHLPLGVDKPMDIFGPQWNDYVNKLEENWQSAVKEEDTVVLPGDFSWATYLDDAKADFEFLSKLNGKKILLKGNHDYWWETMNKMRNYVEENEYKNIYFLQNNCYLYKNIAICGTRGWVHSVLGKASDENIKIYEREIQRLKLSLESAPKGSEKIVFTHFPPVIRDAKTNKFTELLEHYNVKKCIYGHLHAKSAKDAIVGNINNVDYLLVSCDYLNFMPVKLLD